MHFLFFLSLHAASVAVLATTTSVPATTTSTAAPTCMIESCTQPRFRPFQLLKQYAPAEAWCLKHFPAMTTTVTVAASGTMTTTTQPPTSTTTAAKLGARESDFDLDIYTDNDPDIAAAADPDGDADPSLDIDIDLDADAGLDIEARDVAAAMTPQQSTSTPTTTKKPPKIKPSKGPATHTQCASTDYLCAIYDDLTSAGGTFASSMCTCIATGTGTATVTVTTTTTATTSGTSASGCVLATPPPANDTCGADYVYSSPSNYKLLQLGSAASLADCAAACDSTIACLSFGYSAPAMVGGLAICDLYSGTVADLRSSGSLIPAPVVAGQTLQDFFDLECFVCPAPAATTSAGPLPTASSTTMTTSVVTTEPPRQKTRD